MAGFAGEAQEALAIGLVSEVLPDADAIQARAMELAETLAVVDGMDLDDAREVCAEEGVDRGAYCIYGREPERLKVNR